MNIDNVCIHHFFLFLLRFFVYFRVNLEFDILGKKKTLNFKIFEKNLEFWTKIFKKPRNFNHFYMVSDKISNWHKRFMMKINFLWFYQIFFLKSTFKIAKQYLLNIFILFYIVIKTKLNFKIKIDPKMRTFKNLEEIWKTWKKFRKKSATLLFFASLLFKKKDIRWIYIIVNLTYFDLLYPDWISRIE